MGEIAAGRWVRWLALVVLGAGSMLVAGCGSENDAASSAGASVRGASASRVDPSPASKASGKPIVIGIVEDRSGPVATASQLQVDMVKLVAAQMNAGNFMYAKDAVGSRPGIGGRPVELIYEDDQGNPNLTVLRAQKLVDRGARAILLTTTSAATLQGRVVCEKEQVPCISPNNVNPKIVEPPDDGFIFTVAPPITLLADGMAQAFKDLGYETVGFYLADDPNQQAFTDLYAEPLKAAGLRIVAREAVPQGATDNTSQLVRLKDADPDVVVDMSAAPSAMAQFHQSRQRAGLQVPVWSSNALTVQPEAWELAGAALDGALVIDSLDPANPNTRQATELYRAADPAKPFVVTMGQTADAMMLLKIAFERAKGTSGVAVRDALARIEDFPSAHGRGGYTLTFSPDNHNGGSPAGLAIVEFGDGKPHLWDEFQPGAR